MQTLRTPGLSNLEDLDLLVQACLIRTRAKLCRMVALLEKDRTPMTQGHILGYLPPTTHKSFSKVQCQLPGKLPYSHRSDPCIVLAMTTVFQPITIPKAQKQCGSCGRYTKNILLSNQTVAQTQCKSAYPLRTLNCLKNQHGMTLFWFETLIILTGRLEGRPCMLSSGPLLPDTMG